MPDDDDRPRDASSAADASWADVVIPDDISALSGDIEAYRREQRHARRQAQLHRWVDHRGALPLAIVAFAVVIAGLVATLLTVMAPTVGKAPPAAVAPATPTAPPGAVGGRLPVASLAGPLGPTPTSSLRPAVLVLVPVNCDCVPLLTAMAGEANGVGLDLSVVVPAARDAAAAALPQKIKGLTVNVYYDPARTLATTFRVDGVTAVLVGKDGLVANRLPVALDSMQKSFGGPLTNLVR